MTGKAPVQQAGVKGSRKMKTEVESLKSQIVHVLKRYDVGRAAIFGSFATGEAREDSDLDILIEFVAQKRKSLLDLAGLKIELEQASGRNVDIVEYSTIHPLLKDKILKEQKVIL